VSLVRCIKGFAHQFSAQVKVTNEVFPPRSHSPVFDSESSIPRNYATVLNTPDPIFGGSAACGWRSPVSQPPWNFQRYKTVDHTLGTRSIAAPDFGEGEGSTTGVGGISSTVPTLLLLFLKEVLRSHTKQVFSGDPAGFQNGGVRGNRLWKPQWQNLGVKDS